MSRLIVKNLPPYVTPARLREHFERSDGPGGTLTDVKVALKPDGGSRRFGFVGFKSNEEATKAREWFDRTFIDSSRIAVTVVDGAKDAPAPRPNKRPRLGTSPTDQGVSQSSVGLEKSAKDLSIDPLKTSASKKESQLDQYMEVMQARSKKGPSWANDAQQQTPQATPTAVKKKSKENRSKQTSPPPNNDAHDPEEDKGEGMSDLDWMRRRMSRAMDLAGNTEDRVFEQDDDMKVEEARDEEVAGEVDPVKATILETSRLFVRNLAFSCTEEELSQLFQPYGPISQVHIPLDPLTKKAKGLAYVSFAQPDKAVEAYQALDKTSFQGRLLHILAAVDRKGKERIEEGDGHKRSLKEQRGAAKKAAAGKEFNWAMLYMNADAVASSIADRMNIPKADILNPDSDNAAVKLALAETHVINETKAYLTSQGVDLSSFASRARSDTALLVKNIPYGTSADAIREMFEAHGELTKVLVPPAGTMAIVEFVQPDDTAKAFRAVAYRRLGNSIVYLEKAPAGLFSGLPVDQEKPTTHVAHGVPPVRIDDAEVGSVAKDGEGTTAEQPLAAGATLFVKNISFATTSDRLTQVFRQLPGFAFARVQMRQDPKHPDSGERVSAGYGFVGFRTPVDAQKALKGIHGFVLDGHALVVKFAGRDADEPTKEGGKKKARSTKMIVKNVPFEATRKDIRDLFGAHGQLKSVRLPKKFDRRSRGFAFLEFLTRQEAENAYEALKHTHLLGRHLVLEWAAEGEQDIDALRAKASVGYGSGKELPGKKRKLQMNEEEGDAEEDA